MSEDKKKLDPVIDGGATVHKKSKGKAAVESFLGEEIEEVKNHIVYDMIIPSTKDAMSNMFGSIVDFFNDMIHEFIDSIFFGSSETPRSSSSQTYVSYQGYYNKGKTRTSRPARQVSTSSKRHTIDEVEFESDEKETALEKATKVYLEMIDRIERYNEVSVAEFFDMAHITLDWVEEQEKDAWGWKDPSAIGKPRRRRGKYIIPLPRPVSLEE